MGRVNSDGCMTTKPHPAWSVEEVQEPSVYICHVDVVLRLVVVRVDWSVPSSR